MPYLDKDLGEILPTRTGDAQGTALERKMLDRVDDTCGFHTAFRQNPDGGFTMLRTKGGSPQFSTTTVSKSIATAFAIPDFYSGFVDGGFYGTYGMLAYHPTTIGADKATKLPWASYEMPRFSVASYVTGTYDPGNVTPTQYAFCRPYFYTGRMRKLVQFLLSYGIQPTPSWYDTRAPKFSTPVMVDKVYYPAQEQVKYNFTYAQSHGLVTASDGKQWVVEISGVNGVLAYPLVYVSGTDTTAFRDWLVVIGDSEGLAVVDEFGGFPSGYCATANIAALIKSGAVIRLLTQAQVSRYTETGPLAPQIGWAFSESGRDARVVGMFHVGVIGTAEDWMSSRYLSVVLTIGATRDPVASAARTALSSEMASVASGHIELQWKLAYMSNAQAESILFMVDHTAKVAALESLVVEPIAAASATLSVIEEAPWSAKNGMFKVWQPGAGCCASVIFSANTGAGSPPWVDFCAFVYFDGASPVELRATPARTGYSGGMYINGVFDRRDSTASSKSVSERVCTLGGWADCTLTGDGYEYALTRYKWALVRDIVTSSTGNYAKSCAFIPFGDRESVVLAADVGDAGGGWSSTVRAWPDKVQDNTYLYVQRRLSDPYPVDTDGYITTHDGCYIHLERVAWWGEQLHVSTPRESGYVPDPGSVGEELYINSGDQWIARCTYGASIYAAAAAFQLPDTLDRTDYITPHGPTGTFEAVAIFGRTVRQIINDTDTPSALYTKYQQWFALSPEMFGGTSYYCETSANCFGGTVIQQASKELNSFDYKLYGTFPSAVLETNLVNFIGVV